MYNKNDHKVLKNSPRNKKLPSFERGDHVEAKCIIKKMSFYFKKYPQRALN